MPASQRDSRRLVLIKSRLLSPLMLDASWRVSGQGVSQGRHADPQLQMFSRNGPKLATESPLIVEGMGRQVPESFGFRDMK